MVVRGGSTRTQPPALRCTQYQKFPLSRDAFQASEALVSVVAVMCRFVGVDGGEWSRTAPAVPTSSADARTTTPAANKVLRNMILSLPAPALACRKVLRLRCAGG